MTRVPKAVIIGIFDPNGGSVVSANYFIVKELLNRNYEIYNFAIAEDFNPCFTSLENYKPILIPENKLKKFLTRLPLLKKSYYWLFLVEALTVGLQNKTYKKLILEYHTKIKFDYLIFLGLSAKFSIPEIRTISWLQSPAHTEELFINKLAGNIIKHCGLFCFLKLKFGYLFKRLNETKLDQASDQLICGSSWSKEEMISAGINSSKVHFLPYPIDLNVFNYQPLLPRENKTFQILWLGRNVPRKRIDLLLSAFELLCQKHKNVRLKIIGGFSYAPQYQKLLVNHKFKEYIEYTPNIAKNSVPELLRQTDLVIQTSEGENFGSSIAEALASGVPVILGKTNGTKDFIDEGGFVFTEYTPQAICDCIEHLMEVLSKDGNLLREKARNAALNHFDIKKIINNFENIINK